MRVGLAVVAAIAGVTVGLQGLGVPIGRSFMIGDLRWTAVGIVLVAFAAVVLWQRLRRR
ncbi:MAG: hypothetical protein HY263_07030 [Chloroflexi bacterium]|nr:hypothetical protein [Chloroflexota bacterium]